MVCLSGLRERVSKAAFSPPASPRACGVLYHPRRLADSPAGFSISIQLHCTSGSLRNINVVLLQQLFDVTAPLLGHLLEHFLALLRLGAFETINGLLLHALAVFFAGGALTAARPAGTARAAGSLAHAAVRRAGACGPFTHAGTATRSAGASAGAARSLA